MKFVARSAWGARPPESVSKLNLSSLDTLVFHYSAANSDEQSDHANCAGRVRGIQNYHMDKNGWADIGYNFLVCKHGYVFEGRGWGVMPAATEGHNSHTHAVCFLGDDTVLHDDVTTAGRQGLVDIAHVWVTKTNKTTFKGHKDFNSTACPGNEIYAFVTSARFKELVSQESTPKLWPIPIPSWFWAWAKWRMSGRVGPRPASAPATIPDWAWRRLAALIAARK